MKKIVFYMLPCFFMVLFGCNSNTPTLVKIGASFPLTGDFASYGKRAQNGIALAVFEINNSDKYDFQMEVIFQDNKGTSKEAVNIINRFAAIDNYQVVIGGASSMESLAMLPIANSNKVILISPISSSPELSMDDYFFRICPSDAFQAVMMADWLKDLNLSNIAILYINSNWGVSLKNEFIKKYEANGGKISIIESMNEGEKDFKTHITKILEKNPNAIYCISYGAEGGTILKQFKELGYKKKIFGADVWSSPELLSSASNAAEGVYLIKPAEYKNKNFEEFKGKYNAKYNEIPDVYAAYSYDVVYIIANALKITDKSGSKIKDFFLNMPSYEGTTGATKFDDLGDCNSKPFARLQIKDGEFIEVAK